MITEIVRVPIIGEAEADVFRPKGWFDGKALGEVLVVVESIDSIWRREIGERLSLLASAVQRDDQEMADEFGVDWESWCRGDILLPPPVARQLKQRFGCAFDWLYLGDDSHNTAGFNERLEIETEG